MRSERREIVALGVEASKAVGFGNGVDREGGGSGAEGESALDGVVVHALPGGVHAGFEAVVDLGSSTSLYPLEVGDNHSSGVGEDVGDDGDSVGGEGFVGIGGGRSVRALDDECGLDIVGVRPVDYAFDGGGDEEIDVEEKEIVFGRDRVGVGEPDDAAGAVDVIFECA